MASHFCKLHSTAYFKRGKMPGYAHTIKDESGEPILDNKGKQVWCNEEMADAPPVETPDQAQIDSEVPQTAPKPAPKPASQEPAPQAVGMMTKEIGDMIRAKYLVSIYGQEAANELIRWYRNQGLGITRIAYDGTKLPKFEVTKKATPKAPQIPEEVEDRPF